MGSPRHTPASLAEDVSAVTALSVPTEPLPEDNEIEADDDADSANGGSVASETTSIHSALYRGYVENGRRYQSLSERSYYLPADDKQFESAGLTHLLMLIIDCQRSNPLFRAPIPEKGYVLDLGTGSAEWAIDVADKFPHLIVHGVDLSPPPKTWVPPNCILEVDDIGKQPWTWSNKWDLIHARYLVGSFNEEEFIKVYEEAYKNLNPGGWFETVEADIGFYCDDGSLPEKSALATHRSRFMAASERAGRPFDAYEKTRGRLEAAGFTSIQEQEYKCPLGTWPKHPIYRDCGRVKAQEVKTGMEGWCIFLLTNFGDTKPWSIEEATVLLAKMRSEIDNPSYHIYQKSKRIWCQKPFDEVPKTAEA